MPQRPLILCCIGAMPLNAVMASRVAAAAGARLADLCCIGALPLNTVMAGRMAAAAGARSVLHRGCALEHSDGWPHSEELVSDGARTELEPRLEKTIAFFSTVLFHVLLYTCPFKYVLLIFLYGSMYMYSLGCLYSALLLLVRLSLSLFVFVLSRVVAYLFFLFFCIFCFGFLDFR